MLKIRLMRIGAKQKPFYRVVVLDERSKRNGAYIELLGTYNPLTEPKDIKLKQDRIDHWIKQGAQLSVGFLRITGKAPQRPPRKAKKPARNASQSDAGGAPKEEPKKAEEISQPTAEKTEETKTEETKTDETKETPVGEKAQEEKTETPEQNKTNEPKAETEDSSEKTESEDGKTSESEEKNEGSA